MNLLGKGGFATVYKARCLRTQQMVAIKMASFTQNLFKESRVNNNICFTD